MNYPHLLQPLVVRGHIIKNRMESANSLPHFLQGPEKYPAEGVITHYVNRAKAGAAIVTCMGINDFNEDKHMPMEVDAPHFPDFDLYNAQCQNYLLQLADALHFYGSIACMGFFMATNKYPVLRQENPMDEGHLECRQYDMPPEPFMDPTPEKEQAYFLACQKAVADFSREDMEFIADSYAQQCKILQFLGFDMATIHLCYRTQVPTKFLSPLTNQRTDEFGGSVENRARFPLMILQRIREAVGPKFLLEIQLSAEEDKYGGYTLDDTVEFLRLCEPYLDFVQLRASDADGNHPTNYEPLETPVLRQAAYIKQKGTKVLIAPVGGWQNPDTAEKALAEGKVDMISMARAWVSNPDYGKMIYEGRADDIVPCLRCNKCHGHGPDGTFVSICSVNPKVGIEHRLSTLVTKPGPSQKVAVIGGGPAGLKVAMDLCDRGHKVTLYEAADHLGGAIYHADFVDFKWTLKNFKDYLVRQVGKRDIEVKLNTRATPEMIAAEHYDVVVAALGAKPALPPIPGVTSENTVSGVESMLHPEALGKNVVIIGGGEVGVEAGLNLAKKGHDVTILEMRDILAADATAIHFRTSMEAVWRSLDTFHGICNVTVTGVSPEGVSYQDKDGVTHTIPADSVVVSTGMTPLRDEAMAFYGTAQRFFPIGDCTKPATIQQAMRKAFAVASQI